MNHQTLIQIKSYIKSGPIKRFLKGPNIDAVEPLGGFHRDLLVDQKKVDIEVSAVIG